MKSMISTRAGGLAAILIAAALVAPAAADEPTAADLFNDQVLHEIRLSMHGDDWGLLQAHFLDDTYYPADFSWNGVTVRNVGIRSRGTGSRDPLKPSLKIDFERYVSDQGFVGLKSLVLDNFRQDPGMMKESLSMQLFRKMGVAAPRVMHARLYINNEYIGLYATVEPIDKRFLKSALGENSGYLYEYEWADGYRFAWLGTNLERYAGMFTPKTHESESPEQLFGPIERMIAAANHSPRDEWEAAVGARLDLDTLVAYLAVETFLADHDGFAGDWGLNNLYAYRRQDSERFLLIPWDKDVNFRELDRTLYAGFEENVLLSTLITYPRLRDAYLGALRRCAAIAVEGAGEATPGWLEAEVTREVGLIRTAAYEDTRKPYTNERFEEEVAWMLTFARHRSHAVVVQTAP